MALIWARILLLLGATALSVAAADPRSIALPPRPERSGTDLVAALEQRRSVREFAATALTMEDVSALLWAGNGVNRPDGRRTAPTARNRQYIELYLAGPGGAFRYDAGAQALVAVADADVRGRMGQQAHVGSASYVLVLAADLARIPAPDEATRLAWAHSTAGAVAQNVALMAAARGIGTGIVALIKAEEIRRSLSLPSDTIPLYVMPLGYQKK